MYTVYFSYFSASKWFNSGAFAEACRVHRSHGLRSKPLYFLSRLQRPVSWNQQLEFISSLPNLHWWLSQWLSVMDENGKYKQASARNQSLYYLREGFLNKVYDMVSKLQNQQTQPQQSTSTSTFISTPLNTDDLPSAPKRRREPNRQLTMIDLLVNITSLDPEFSSQNLSQELSSYEKFKFAVTENGNLFWR